MIPTKPNFVKITVQLFGAQIMKYTLFGSFQYRAKRFCRIIMNIATRILFVAVVDPIMGGKPVSNGSIRMVFIGHQMRTFIDKSIHLRIKLTDLITNHRCGPNRAVAFDRHQHSLFVSAFATFVFNLLLITRFAADVFFIQLDNTAKRRDDLIGWIHHGTHRMAQFPGAFLRDANPFGQNHRGYALG